MNITIDDTHPQIDYHGNWSGWRPAEMDKGTPYNFRGTFHTIWNENHWMNYTFNGSAISVYGTKWLNHGAYSVQIDGGDEETFEGYDRDRLYNSLLYSSGPLDMGTHELASPVLSPSPITKAIPRLFNRPSRTTILEQDASKNRDKRLWFDVDYMVVEVPVPDGANVTTTIIDDTDSSITYSPEWSPRPNSEQGFFNTTAHQTNVANAGFALPFKGSSIQLFGTIGTDVGNYTVAVDGQLYERELNGTWYERRTNSPLFFLSGLQDGPHELALVNLGRGPERSNFEFDYAVVNSTSASGGSVKAPDGSVDNPTGAASAGPGATGASGSDGATSGGNTNSGQAQGSSSNSTSTPVGAIVGGVIGGLAAIALLVLLLLCLRRRNRRNGYAAGDGDSSEHSAEDKAVHQPEIRVGSRAPGLSGNEVHPYHLPQQPRPQHHHLAQPGSPTTTHETGMAGVGDSSMHTAGLSSGSGSGYPSEKRGFQSVQGRSEGSSSAYSPASEGHHPSFNAIMGGNAPYGSYVPPVPLHPGMAMGMNQNPHLDNYGHRGQLHYDRNPITLGMPLAPQRTNSTGYLSTGTAGNMASASSDAVAGEGGRRGSSVAPTATNYETAPSRTGSPAQQQQQRHEAHAEAPASREAPPPGYAESMQR